MDAVRLRLVFDELLLSEKQMAEGLGRCWLLLKPQLHASIFDLTCHVLGLFHLHDTCPSGLLLSMGGYSLPPFESTSIFKDKDIVRVKKKETDSAIEMIKDEYNDPGLDQAMKIMNQSLIETTQVKLLSMRDDDKLSHDEESNSESEHGRCTLRKELKDDVLCIDNGLSKTDGVSKKRKAFKDLHSRSRKKKKPENVEDGALLHNDGNNAGGKQGSNLNAKKVDKITKRRHKNAGDFVTPCSLTKNGDNKNVSGAESTEEPKKIPSRSARRKKAKRRWLRELFNAQKQEEQDEVAHREELATSVNICDVVQKEKSTRLSDDSEKSNRSLNEDSETDEDMVPVVIRPGHIRFQSSRTVSSDLVIEADAGSLLNFQWSNTSKKKGQKWGTEKAPISSRLDHNSVNQVHSQSLHTEAQKCEYNSINFNELSLYKVPKIGDVIAYRLVELSPSWTPEISSYRVGKISQYDIETRRISLTPVAQFPLPNKIENDETLLQTEISPCNYDYMEDGLLEISYDSLVEVRLVYHGEEGSSGLQHTALNRLDDLQNPKCDDNVGILSLTQENKIINTLDELKQMVEMKKTELMQDDCGKPSKSGRGQWSNRTLRGCSLGPTMALLRSENVK